MIHGLISPELRARLLEHGDPREQSRGLEELRALLRELDPGLVSPAGVLELLQVLRVLAESGGGLRLRSLRLLELVLRRLDRRAERYTRELLTVALRALGDPQAGTRRECQRVCGRVLRAVSPRELLELLAAPLRHRSARVRADTLDILTAALLAHPRRDFGSIPALCLEVAPLLADGKRKVRHAALELFAVLDSRLDAGGEELLLEGGGAEGLRAAVRARRARQELPRLCADGTLEYALRLDTCSGPDLDWVLSGGSESGSLRRARRRIARGKHKLPWERRGDTTAVGSSEGQTSRDPGSVRAASPDGSWSSSASPHRAASDPEPAGVEEERGSRSHARGGQEVSVGRPRVTRSSPASVKLLESEEELPGREEMLTLLRPLKNIAAKKRAELGVLDRDPDSCDSAVKLEPPVSPDQTCASLSSPMSESGVSSLHSPPSPGPAHSSPVKAHRRALSSPVTHLLRVETEASAPGVVGGVSAASGTRVQNDVSPRRPPRDPRRRMPANPGMTSDPEPTLQPAPPSLPPSKSSALRSRRTSLTRTRLTAPHSTDGLVSESLTKTELQHPDDPEQMLQQNLTLLSSDNWEKKLEGLTLVRSLSQHHPDVLLSRIHSVCLAVVEEVKNLRSGVSRVAVCLLGELFVSVGKGMDSELELVASALLHKAAETNAFIRQEVDAALEGMVQQCSPKRSVSALLSGGLGHQNPQVRRCAAQHLCSLMDRAGPARLLTGPREQADRLVMAAVKLAQDSSPETRVFGRQMLLTLSTLQDFDRLVERCVPGTDAPGLREVVVTLQRKGPAPSSTRGRRFHSGIRLLRATSLTRDPVPTSSKTTPSLSERSEYKEQMRALLSSRDFQERLSGIDRLVSDCQRNPALVLGCLLPVFDQLVARLQESNSKVNLRALQAVPRVVVLLGGALAPVLNTVLPALVENHLNSKNANIHTAALAALRALMEHMDGGLLLPLLCSRAQSLSGTAKVDLIQMVSELVLGLYPQRPQVVQQKVLPLLWALLGSSRASGSLHSRGPDLRAATAALARHLHVHMGHTLQDSASLQSLAVQKQLHSILRNGAGP